MIDFSEHRSHLIVGVQGQGKTTLALALALASSPTVVVYDVNGQFPPEFRCRLEQLEERLDWPESLSVIVPHPRAREQVWRRLMLLLEGWEDLCLVVDESSVLQRAGACDPDLEALLRFCRQRRVVVIQTTHRIVDLVKVSRTLATDVWVFRLGMEADRAMLESDFPGFPADRVLALSRHHVVHYWVDAGGTYRYAIWDRPRDWFPGDWAAGDRPGGSSSDGPRPDPGRDQEDAPESGAAPAGTPASV